VQILGLHRVPAVVHKPTIKDSQAADVHRALHGLPEAILQQLHVPIAGSAAQQQLECLDLQLL